jgi:methyl-accepting chemotaxis protein
LIASTGSVAIAVLVAVAATASVIVVVSAVLSLRRSARELQELVGELTEHTAAVLGSAEDTLSRAQEELTRVDDLIGSAEAITETVGSASRLAHAAVAAPLIKVMAFGAGTAKAGRRLRRAG